MSGTKNLNLKSISKRSKKRRKFNFHGVLDTDLLEIVRDRLKAFQAGPFASKEKKITCTHTYRRSFNVDE